MLGSFAKIVEERIQQGLRKGAFNNLEGAGKPLSFDDAHIPEELRLAYKMLKNADCLPPELEIRKEIRQTEDLLKGMPDTEVKYRATKKLNLLIMKLNASRKGAIEFDMPQRYQGKLVDRVQSTTGFRRTDGSSGPDPERGP